MSARQFNRDVSAAKRASENGPLFITDRGTPSHVLLTMAEYERLARRGRSLADALAPPDDRTGSIDDFEPARLTFVPRVPDL